MKRIFAILAAVLLTSVCAMAQSNDATPLKGDVNGDGMVDVADIVAVIDVMEKGDAGYFYLGTTQPTAENYASLPGVVSTYTSITEANDATINVTDGQTIYLLCPVSWVEGKTVKLDDNDGNPINFSEDLETVSGYVVYTANGLSSSKTISLKVENTVVNYYWYVGQTNPSLMSSITPIVTDNTSPGWRLIGTSLPTYSSSNKLFEYVEGGEIVTGTSLAKQYIAIPANSSACPRDGFGADASTVDIYNKLSNVTISGVEYKVYETVGKMKKHDLDIF